MENVQQFVLLTLAVEVLISKVLTMVKIQLVGYKTPEPPMLLDTTPLFTVKRMTEFNKLYTTNKQINTTPEEIFKFIKKLILITVKMLVI